MTMMQPEEVSDDREAGVIRYITDRDKFSHQALLMNFRSQERAVLGAFLNEYRPEKWNFHANFRNPNASYFASDVVKCQYKYISTQYGFYGTRPELIERREVINETTLDKTKGLSGTMLKDVFLNETPNGRSTQRILDVFNLWATEIRREGSNFFIAVEPRY
ncbi:hypothetical protein [Citrobacter koseri]|uniref:hypothetical protein n=1 Tax=Citrobacter koseri TaxID=545 RepID=UPI001F159F33|nr:hypothetical protein [Citrobacter koseri]